MFSGMKIDPKEFAGGWALPASQNSKTAHYFDGPFSVAACGALVLPLMHIGDWKACDRCVFMRGRPTIQQREIARNIKAEMAFIAQEERENPNA